MKGGVAVRFNYGSYAQVMYAYLKPRPQAQDLPGLLLIAAFEKEERDLGQEKQTFSKMKNSIRSDYFKCKRSIASNSIQDYYWMENAHGNVRAHFGEKIITRIEKGSYKRLTDVLRDLVQGDRFIDSREQSRLLNLAEKVDCEKEEALVEFLSETFITAVQAENKISDSEREEFTAFIESLKDRKEPSTEQSAEVDDFSGKPPKPATSSHSSNIIPFPYSASNGTQKLPGSDSFFIRYKKTIIISLTILILLAGAGIYFLDFFSGNTDIKIVPEFDRHVLLQMELKQALLQMELEQENAVHYYAMGLNNWRRLEYAKAEEEITGALEDLSKYEGQAEMDIARMNNSLGCLYLDMGKYEEAGKLLNSAYNAFRKSFDDNSIEVRAVKAGLAQYDYYMGNYDRALKETEEIIELSNPKKDKAITATTSHFRATVLNSLGRYDEALALYEQVLLLYDDVERDKTQAMNLAAYTNDSSITDAKREYYKTAARWIILSHANMGVTHMKAGDTEAAHAELATALDFCLNTWFIGQKTLMTADIYRDLAVVQHQLGDTRGAMTNAENAILVQRYLFDFEDNYAGLAQSYRVQADIFADTDSEKALSIYIKALDLAEHFFGEKHPQTAAAYQALGRFYLGQEDYTQALECLERALAIRSSLMLMNNMDTLALYRDLQRAADALGQQDKLQVYTNEIQALEDALNENR